jgi:hypothetical protein
VESHDGEPARLEALEPEHLAAFDAFRRPATPADRQVADEPTAATHVNPSLNTDLARRVYAGDRGSIDIIPGPGTICCVAIYATTGETTIGDTSTELAAADGLGHVRGGSGTAVDFVGVLPAGASNLRIIDRNGRETPIPLNHDRAYWTTVLDPIDMLWTTSTGAQRQGVFGRFKNRVPNDPPNQQDANGDG